MLGIDCTELDIFPPPKSALDGARVSFKK